MAECSVPSRSLTRTSTSAGTASSPSILRVTTLVVDPRGLGADKLLACKD
jgi:hypothetical protein